jgi:Flp pilus assembly pilin Flp
MIASAEGVGSFPTIQGEWEPGDRAIFLLLFWLWLYCPDSTSQHTLTRNKEKEKGNTMQLVRRLWTGEEGQDIAEYAVMLAVILVIVVGTIRLIGSNANTVFSNVASSIQ